MAKKKQPNRKVAKHPLWLHAASFAARAHRHQLRKDGSTPYFAHCVRVAMIVRDVFGCEDEAAVCAAYLHDTIEDTPTDFDDIEAAFGRAIAEMVASLTKNMLLREAERERDYDARLSRADWRARLVKLADVYDNFIDAATRLDQARRDTRREKAYRALKLAKADAKTRPEMARALAALEKVLKNSV
jgi:guanosine-3',5'-bis(diphosphate) 3'-pyrophosphohydrolase